MLTLGTIDRPIVNLTSSPFVIPLASHSLRGLFLASRPISSTKQKKSICSEFCDFCAFSTSKKTKPNSANILLFKSGCRMSHSNGDLKTSWSWRNLLVAQRKGTKSVVDRDSHSGKNCHHFCCTPARTAYGSPADKYNLFLFFSHFTCTFHLWNIKTSHEVPVNPLAPQHPSSGMCCGPSSSCPAVRGLRPGEQLMVRVYLIFPCLHQEGPTLRIFS